MKNQNNYAVITGATSGIGFELAKLFAHDGYNLVIVARDHSQLESKAHYFRTAYDVDVIPIARDLFTAGEAFNLYKDTTELGITVDVLVNNAGQGLYGDFTDTDIKRELAIIELNISSVVVLTKCYLLDMAKRNEGKILNVASVASKLPGPWQSVYHGTKAFVLSFTEAIREELKATNITVTALMPGVTDTDFFNKAGMQNSKAVEDENAMADPADVAKDGFRALMAGDDKVVSGFMNKIQVSISNITPDSMVAKQVNKQQGPR